MKLKQRRIISQVPGYCELNTEKQREQKPGFPLLIYVHIAVMATGGFTALENEVLCHRTGSSSAWFTFTVLSI